MMKSRKLLQLKNYLDFYLEANNSVQKKPLFSFAKRREKSISDEGRMLCSRRIDSQLEHYVSKLDSTFTEELFKYIDQKKKSDVEIYKAADIDRRLFSKMRSDMSYKPSKATAIALGIALRLNLDEMLDFIGKAGYTLSMSNKFDLIIRYHVEKKIFDVLEINDALFAFNETLLNAKSYQ